MPAKTRQQLHSSGQIGRPTSLVLFSKPYDINMPPSIHRYRFRLVVHRHQRKRSKSVGKKLRKWDSRRSENNWRNSTNFELFSWMDFASAVRLMKRQEEIGETTTQQKDIHQGQIYTMYALRSWNSISAATCSKTGPKSCLFASNSQI